MVKKMAKYMGGNAFFAIIIIIIIIIVVIVIYSCPKLYFIFSFL